jgi:hypothetical protein
VGTGGKVVPTCYIKIMLVKFNLAKFLPLKNAKVSIFHHKPLKMRASVNGSDTLGYTPSLQFNAPSVQYKLKKYIRQCKNPLSCNVPYLIIFSSDVGICQTILLFKSTMALNGLKMHD